MTQKIASWQLCKQQNINNMIHVTNITHQQATSNKFSSPFLMQSFFIAKPPPTTSIKRQSGTLVSHLLLGRCLFTSVSSISVLFSLFTSVTMSVEAACGRLERLCFWFPFQPRTRKTSSAWQFKAAVIAVGTHMCPSPALSRVSSQSSLVATLCSSYRLLSGNSVNHRELKQSSSRTSGEHQKHHHDVLSYSVTLRCYPLTDVTQVMAYTETMFTLLQITKMMNDEALILACNIMLL